MDRARGPAGTARRSRTPPGRGKHRPPRGLLPTRSVATGAASEHEALAAALAAADVDLLLCETFPHPGEALHAVRAAVATGLDTWLALTAGPRGTLMDPQTLRATADRAVQLGAKAVLVNCVAASSTVPFIEALSGLAVPIGVSANV